MNESALSMASAASGIGGLLAALVLAVVVGAGIGSIGELLRWCLPLLGVALGLVAVITGRS